MGEGKVQDLAPLSRTVFVRIPNHGVKEFDLEEISPVSKNSGDRAGENQKSQRSNEQSDKFSSSQNNQNKNRRGNQRRKNRGNRRK
jgi:hypothetical protein